MKNFRKIIAFILSAIMTLSFASCSDSSLKVGIIQIAPHASLDNCYEGIVEGLKQAGYENGKNITIDYQNANGETATSNLMAKKMVSSKYDIIIGIATPAAMSAYSATRNTDIPVVFSAVSDPVTIQIVKSLEKPEYNCTGTTDVLNLEAQMEMIRTFLPNAKKIGVLYTTSEQNSVTHLNKFKSIAPDYGFEIVAVGVTNATEVATAAKTLVSKGIDCINNFTDNNVVNNLSSVLNAANTANIPVFGSEVEQVKNGCIAAEGLDYVHLGRETGMMAAKILEGDAKAGEMAESNPVYNNDVLKEFGLTLPDAYKTAEVVTSNK